MTPHDDLLPPWSFRRALADRIEPRLAVILGVSIALHLGVAVWGLNTDREVDRAEPAYRRMYEQERIAFEDPEPAVTDSSSGTDEAGVATQVQALPKEAPTPTTPRRRADEAVSTGTATATAFADLTGDGAVGRAEGDLALRRPGVDLDAQINAVAGDPIEVGATRHASRSGDTRVGTQRELSITSLPTAPAQNAKHDESARGTRVAIIDNPDIDAPPPDEVLHKIMTVYKTGIMRCYLAYLVTVPSARGKVALSFTVGETGRTSKIHANGFADEIDRCIDDQVRTWHFSVRSDSDAVGVPFAITLQLVPAT